MGVYPLLVDPIDREFALLLASYAEEVEACTTMARAWPNACTAPRPVLGAARLKDDIPTRVEPSIGGGVGFSGWNPVLLDATHRYRDGAALDPIADAISHIFLSGTPFAAGIIKPLGDDDDHWLRYGQQALARASHMLGMHPTAVGPLLLRFSGLSDRHEIGYTRSEAWFLPAFVRWVQTGGDDTGTNGLNRVNRT